MDKLEPIRNALGEKFDLIEFVSADLTDAESIMKAVEGCDYVIHTASPNPPTVPRDEFELITPAVEGTRAVLEACKAHKVKRLVITSSTAAVIDYSEYEGVKTVDEDSWLVNFGKILVQIFQ